MVVVKIELWPHGDHRRKREIGRAVICNDGKGTEATGTYYAAVGHAGTHSGKPGIWRSVAGVSYRRRLSPYHLVRNAMQAICSASGHDKQHVDLVDYTKRVEGVES